MADLAVKSSTVAIAAQDDVMYEFYLLKVSLDGIVELKEDFTDDYGSSYRAGHKILKERFYL